MRVVLPWLVAAVLASVVVLHWVPLAGDHDPDTASGGRRSDRGRERSLGPFDRNQIAGEDVVTWVEDRSMIAGVVHTWPRLLLHARGLRPESEEAFRLDGVLLLANARPESLEDLERLVRADPDLPARALGESFRRRRAEVAWVEAATAILLGGAELTDANQVVARDGVTAGLPALRSPLGALNLSIPSLTVELTRSDVTRLHGSGRLVLDGELGRFEGESLDVDVRTGRLSIERNLVGDLRRPDRLDGRVPPLHVEADGPLTFVPDSPNEGRLSLAGTLTILGNVWLAGPDRGVRAAGGRLSAHTVGQPPRIREIVLDRGSTLTAPFGDISAPSMVLVMDPERADTFTIGDGPVSGTLRGGSRLFATLGSLGDVTWTTAGRVTVEGFDRADGAIVARVGPGVALAGPSLEAQIRGYLTVRLRRVPDSRADAPPDATVLAMTSLDLDGGVTATGGMGALESRTLSYSREFHASGVPKDDVVVLDGNPTLELNTRASDRDVSNPREWVRIASSERIILRRDPSSAQPLRLEAGPHVDVRWFDGPGSDGTVARLGAARLTAALAESWWHVLTPTATLHAIEGHRDVASFDAEGRVILQTRAGHSVDAERVRFDRDADTFLVERARSDTPAEILLKLGAALHRISAESLHYDLVLRRVTAQRGGRYEGDLPLIDFGQRPEGVGATVATSVSARAVTLVVAAEDTTPLRALVGTLDLASVSAKDGVEIRQGTLVGTCDSIDAQFGSATWLVIGRPARIERRESAEYEESVQARIISASAETMLARGDVEGRLGMEPLFGPSGSRALTTFLTAGDLRITPTKVDVPEGGSVVQGDPAQRGFRLTAPRFDLALARPEGVAGKPKPPLEVEQATATGGATFRSGRIEAEGEELRYDRARSRLWLESSTGRALVRLDGVVNAPRDAWEIDMGDPDRPKVTARSRGNRDD